VTAQIAAALGRGEPALTAAHALADRLTIAPR
jgi:hypothetical protein